MGYSKQYVSRCQEGCLHQLDVLVLHRADVDSDLQKFVVGVPGHDHTAPSARKHDPGRFSQNLRHLLDVLHIQSLDRALEGGDLRGKNFMANLLRLVVLLELGVVLLL